MSSDKSGSGSADSTVGDTDTMVMDSTSSAKEIKPMGPAPEWGPTIKPQMQAVIEKLISYQDKPIPKLTAVQARNCSRFTGYFIAMLLL